VRHVDNTARDGRRLTVLCYLNPDYHGEHGGEEQRLT
jgi:hypoxia-inducible factor (prolyl hydroxylase)